MSQSQKNRHRRVLPRLQELDTEAISGRATAIDDHDGPPDEAYDANTAYERLLEDLPRKSFAYFYVVVGILILIPAFLGLLALSSFGFVLALIAAASLLFGLRILYLHRMRNKLEQSRQRKSNFDD